MHELKKLFTFKDIIKRQSKRVKIEFNTLNKEYQNEYVKAIKAEGDEIQKKLEQTSNLLKWKNQRTKSLKNKLSEPSLKWDDALTKLNSRIDVRMRDVTKYKKLRVFQGLDLIDKK